MNKLTRKNAKIAVAGIYTIGHYRSSQVRVELRTSGGFCAFSFDADRTLEFLTAIDALEEDGQYLHELEGTPVCAWFDGPNGRIFYIGSLFDEGGTDWFVIDKPPKKGGENG